MDQNLDLAYLVNLLQTQLVTMVNIKPKNVKIITNVDTKG